MEDDIRQHYVLWRDEQKLIPQDPLDNDREQSFRGGFERGYKSGDHNGFLKGAAAMGVVFLSTLAIGGLKIYSDIHDVQTPVPAVQTDKNRPTSSQSIPVPYDNLLKRDF